MFYQQSDFIGYSHIQHLVPNFEPFNKAIASIIISACRVSTAKKYDYGNKFNRIEMNKTKIQLPTKNNKIDFDFSPDFGSVNIKFASSNDCVSEASLPSKPSTK